MNKIIGTVLIAALTWSCSEEKNNSGASDELSALQTQLDSLKSLNAVLTEATQDQIATFLTFQKNNAEEAMNFYVNLFENSKIIDVQKYDKDGPAKEGTIMVATFEINGSTFKCSDSYVKHSWTFTPAVSNWVECENEAELQRVFTKLSENGKVMMPLGNYGFSQKFGFVEDRFGVSWQLNLK